MYRTCRGHVRAFELTHARHDAALCQAPGLFQSLQLRKGGRRPSFDITSTRGATAIRFVGFQVLGVDDMRLLQVLVALGGLRGVTLTQHPTLLAPLQLRASLALQYSAETRNGLVIHEKLSTILTELGQTRAGKNYAQLKNSLFRLAAVTVSVTTDAADKSTKTQASFQLLSYIFDQKTGRLMLCLNPQLADAALGQCQYTRIDLNEVRALKTAPAHLIHQRLCGYINAGACHNVKMETLCGYVWPVTSRIKETLNTRQRAVRAALKELTGSGCAWVVTEYAKHKFTIERAPPAGMQFTKKHTRQHVQGARVCDS